MGRPIKQMDYREIDNEISKSELLSDKTASTLILSVNVFGDIVSQQPTSLPWSADDSV